MFSPCATAHLSCRYRENYADLSWMDKAAFLIEESGVESLAVQGF